MLNCRGRNAGLRLRGDTRPLWTLLNSDGEPIIGRRGVLRLLVKLTLLIDLEVRGRLSESHADRRRELGER